MGPGPCKVCGTTDRLVAGVIGVCADCLRERPDEALPYAMRARRDSREEFEDLFSFGVDIEFLRKCPELYEFYIILSFAEIREIRKFRIIQIMFSDFYQRFFLLFRFSHFQREKFITQNNGENQKKNYYSEPVNHNITIEILSHIC